MPDAKTIKKQAMLNPFKKETIYIRLFENKIELRHLERDQSVARNSFEKFSNDRLLIAEVSRAVEFIKEVLLEVRGSTFIKSSLVVLVQPMEKIEGGVSEVEKMIINDMIEQIGGKYAFIHTTQEILSDEQVRQITKA